MKSNKQKTGLYKKSFVKRVKRALKTARTKLDPNKSIWENVGIKNVS